MFIVYLYLYLSQMAVHVDPQIKFRSDSMMFVMHHLNINTYILIFIIIYLLLYNEYNFYR